MSHERIIAQIEALPANPSEVDQIAAILSEAVAGGYCEALPLLIRLRAWARLGEIVNKEISEQAVAELAARGKDNVLFGFKAEQHQSVRYDYSASEEWKAAQFEESKAAGQRKQIEARMKALKGVANAADLDTGELLTGAIPIYGKPSVKLTPLDRPTL